MLLINRIHLLISILFIIFALPSIFSQTDPPTELHKLQIQMQQSDNDAQKKQIKAEIDKRQDYLRKMAKYNKKIIKKSDEFLEEQIDQIRDEVDTLQSMVKKVEKYYFDYLEWCLEEQKRYSDKIEETEKLLERTDDRGEKEKLEVQIQKYNNAINDLSSRPEIAWQSEALQRYNSKIDKLTGNLLFLPPSNEMMEARVQRLFSVDDLASINAELDNSYHIHMYWVAHDNLVKEYHDILRYSSVLIDNPLYILALLSQVKSGSIEKSMSPEWTGESVFFLRNSFFSMEFNKYSDTVLQSNGALQSNVLKLFYKLIPLETDDLTLQKELHTYFNKRVQGQTFINALHVAYVLGQLSKRKQRLFDLYKSDINLTEEYNQFINETAFLAMLVQLINNGVDVEDLKSREIRKKYLQSVEDVTKMAIFYRYYLTVINPEITE